MAAAWAMMGVVVSQYLADHLEQVQFFLLDLGGGGHPLMYVCGIHKIGAAPNPGRKSARGNHRTMCTDFSDSGTPFE